VPVQVSFSANDTMEKDSASSYKFFGLGLPIIQVGSAWPKTDIESFGTAGQGRAAYTFYTHPPPAI